MFRETSLAIESGSSQIRSDEEETELTPEKFDSLGLEELFYFNDFDACSRVIEVNLARIELFCKDSLIVGICSVYTRKAKRSRDFRSVADRVVFSGLCLERNSAFLDRCSA